MEKIVSRLALVWHLCPSWLASFVSVQREQPGSLVSDYAAAAQEVFWRVVKSRPMVLIVIASAAITLCIGSYWVGHRLASRHTRAAMVEIGQLTKSVTQREEEIARLSRQLAESEANLKEAAKPSSSQPVALPRKPPRRAYRRLQPSQPPRAQSQGLF